MCASASAASVRALAAAAGKFDSAWAKLADDLIHYVGIEHKIQGTIGQKETMTFNKN